MITKLEIEEMFEKMAIMIQRGFLDVEKRISVVESRLSLVETTMATKEDLDLLEHRLANRYERRLELVEDDVRILKNKLA